MLWRFKAQLSQRRRLSKCGGAWGSHKHDGIIQGDPEEGVYEIRHEVAPGLLPLNLGF